MIPVSVRSPDVDGQAGNRVSTMIVPIPTDEPEAGRRLERTHEALRSAKERHRALPATLLRDANEFIPPLLFGRASRAIASMAARDRLEPPCNVVISNVPGPQSPLYCAGARVDAMYPVSAILDGVGLNVTVLSYCGKPPRGDRRRPRAGGGSPWESPEPFTMRSTDCGNLTATPSDVGTGNGRARRRS